jgi:hypothetical protein
MEPSVFGGVTETQTGLQGGRNLSATAGLDLRIRAIQGAAVSFEFRGTLPLDKGQIVAEKGIAAGLQFAAPRGRIRPYTNILLGRTQLEYLNNGILAPGTSRAYTLSTTYVFSPGAGVLFDIDDRFSFRADLQYQFAKSPVTGSGQFHSVPLTLGMAYTFTGTRHGRPYP